MAVAVPVAPSYFQFDQQGVVFNMWYFAWFDDAMAQFLGEAGYPYQAMVADGLDVQLVHTEADWREGVCWGESVLVDVATEKIGSTSFTLSFAVRVESQLRSTGRTVYVVVATDGSGKQSIPSKLRAVLESARLSDFPATFYPAVMAAGSGRARIEDVHELAMAMPHVTVEHGPHGNAVYQVGGKSFVFFRNPRPDAVDPVTGERYPDVIVFWVPSEADKQALIQDQAAPFFTTPHFDGHPSVLLRGSRIGELTRQELTEVIQDAWLARASPTRGAAWFKAQSGG